MDSIRWSKTSYNIDGKADFLVSGEVHYFRVPRHEWKERLQLLIDAGGNCVATYIPWILHEPVEGDIRFGDTPERDLIGFLELCHELGLYVICRPGPYQYSEMRYDGLPEWLCEGYPEIHARNLKGETFRKASASYLHPLFLQKVRTWYEKVCPIIARYTVANNGPVAFSQFDNELMGVHVWFGGGWDYNVESMGIGIPGGRYPAYLEHKYKNITHLNEQYGTSFTDFCQVCPTEPNSIQTVGDSRRVKDYQDFYFSTMSEYSDILVSWMREFGIDCGIVHNSPNPASNSSFLEVVKKLGSDFLLGSDHYYTLGPGWDQNNPTPQYASKVFYSNEMLRLMGYPPTVMELPGGSASDWPPFNTEDVRCCYYTNLALGMKGLNYYIFTGGPNPSGIGRFGDIYDYGAGVGADGSIRPVYEVQKELGRFFKENSWLALAERECDFYLGLDWEHSRSYTYCKGHSNTEFSNTEAWELMREGVMISAMCGSLSPNLVDIYSDALLEDLDKPLVITSAAVMNKAVQERLVRFVEAGGKLMLMPYIPYLDENFNSCTILSDFLGGARSKEFNSSFPRINIGNVENVMVNGKVFKSVNPPPEAELIAKDEYTGTEIGWRKDFKNGGTAVWLGFQWVHSMHTHWQMLKYILCEIGKTKQVVICDNPNIWTSLRTDGSKSCLFIMNLFASPLVTSIKVRQPDGTYIDTGRHELKAMEVKTIMI